ncbi:MAG TPA: cytochrome c-type biogenesis CcmF C-terminal domain-containing protein, partial [Gaiellaceae bacterium]
TGYSALAVLLNRKARDLIAWTVPVLGGVAFFFAFMLSFVSSPFATAAAPADGAGMDPALQNPYMLAHPPMLYLGYVGLTIPFAFAMGALLARRTDERWIVATRRWTLAAWTFLGVGQLLGAHWAYVEIGWGGYYAWDPVENAALMPWLAATAFLHSVMIQEKRGMLKVWNVTLVTLAFCLSLFGTFLTRSGVVSSIHSFSQSPIGGWFLGFLAVVVVFSVSLIYLRLPLLRARTKLESLVSREATFLYNNLLLVALALTILWGVVYPLLTQAVNGTTRSVSKPYYDFFLHSFGLPLLLLMGIGPLVAWRRASLRALGKTFAIPAAFAVVTGAVLLALGFGSSTPGLLAYTFSAFVAASIVLEFVRGSRATGSLTRLVARNRRRYGGYLVHAAILLLAIGIAGSSAYQTVREKSLKPGQTMEAAGYTFTYGSLATTQLQNSQKTSATIAVSRGNSHVATLHPGKSWFPVEQSSSNDVSIYHDPRNLGDVYTIADGIAKNGTLDLKVLVKPLVNLVWAAGFVFVFGALVAMWPDAVEQRRLVERYAALPV